VDDSEERWPRRNDTSLAIDERFAWARTEKWKNFAAVTDTPARFTEPSAALMDAISMFVSTPTPQIVFANDRL